MEQDSLRMRNLMKKNCFFPMIPRFVFWIMSFLILSSSANATDIQEKRIEKIRLDNQQCEIRIKLSGETPYKVILVDKRELLIAFKHTRISDKVLPNLADKHLVTEIETERLADHVLALFIRTPEDLEKIKPRWIKKDHTLIVGFIIDREGRTVQSSSEAEMENKNKEKEKKENPDPHKILKISEYNAMTENGKGPSGMDVLFQEIKNHLCTGEKDIIDAINRCENGCWKDALDIVNRHLETQTTDRSVETAYFLRAYVFYKTLEPEDKNKFPDAANFFREAVNYFPESGLVPYGMAALGKIHAQLRNYSEAIVYFKMILDKHKDYRATPEIMLELGRIYSKKKALEPAISIFRKIISDYPGNPYAADASLELGKALLEANRFSESLVILAQLIESNPQKVYETADLLLCMGNLYYQTGEREMARDAFCRAFNYFGQTESRPVILARIGDTFRDAAQPEKALKIYQLVSDHYPGSDGFVISSMRLSENDSGDKEDIYKKIITDFPKNPMAKLAMLKLANLQRASGQNEKSLNTIKQFFNNYPNVLEKEAFFIMEQTYESLFNELMKKDCYPEILIQYETDKHLFNRFENPRLFLAIGKAYLKGHLYAPAAETFKKSHTLFGEEMKPPDLLFDWGVALHESDHPDRAIEMLDAYLKHSDSGNHATEAYFRKGRILLAKKENEKAIKNLKVAFRLSKDSKQQAEILIAEAEGYREIGGYTTVSKLLIEAINVMASIPEKHFDDISLAYRRLGENYYHLKTYLKAADAFSMAVKFSEKPENCSDLYLMIGESYQKGNAPDMAEEAYRDIIAIGDPFWIKLAEEKIRCMKLEKKLDRA